MKYKLLSWNVNGIRAIYKKGFLNWFASEKPDMLCLQETKARDLQLPDDLIHIPGYESIFVSAKKGGYSGVVTYTKKQASKISTGFGIPEFDNEGRTVVTEFPEFMLYNVYFPNGKASKERLDYKMRFCEAFLNHLQKKLQEGKKIIICGDVNTAHKEIDLARPKANETVSGFLPIERQWLDKLFNSGFIDTFRMFNQKPDQYTWWSQRTAARKRNVGWRIDYFIVSDNLQQNISNAYIMPSVLGSDHCPIGLEITI